MKLIKEVVIKSKQIEFDEAEIIMLSDICQYEDGRGTAEEVYSSDVSNTRINRMVDFLCKLETLLK